MGGKINTIMRSILNTFWVIIFAIVYNACVAQVTHLAKDNALERWIAKADLIIEGRVLSTETFMGENPHEAFTSAQIKVTKIFKGTLNDSIVEFVFMGGYYKGGVVLSSQAVNLGPLDEGIFLLSENKSGNTIAKGMASYIEPHGEISCILYHAKLKLPGNHYAVGGGFVCDDLEKDLFQRIEAATGQKRKILGPNIFEINAAKKQQK